MGFEFKMNKVPQKSKLNRNRSYIDSIHTIETETATVPMMSGAEKRLVKNLAAYFFKLLYKCIVNKF